MPPDADGNIRGIVVPALPWVPDEEKPIDRRAWNEACGVEAQPDEKAGPLQPESAQ